MKKSFLITLAAVSSVALIGCSSSSDDNGGSKGPEKKYEYKVSNVLVAPITSVTDGDFLASNVTFTLEKKEQGNAEAVLEPATDDEKANFKIGVICEGDTDGKKAENFVVTADKIAISKTNATALKSDTCNVEVAGELLPESVAKSDKIDLTADKYNKGTVSVSIDGKGVDNTAKTISLDAAVDTAAVEYTVKANEAGTLTVDEAKKTIEIKDGAAITELTIAGSNLDGVFADKTQTDDIFTLEASKAAAAIDNGKVSISKDAKITPAVDYKVTIAKDGGQKPQIVQTPVEDMASTSPAVVIKVTGVPAGIEATAVSCAKLDNTAPVVKKESDYFLIGIDKTKLGKGTKSKCTVTGKESTDFAEIDFAPAQKALKPLVTVVDTSKENAPLPASLQAETVLKQLKATGVKNLKNYAANNLEATNAAIAGVTNIVVSSTDKADATILAVDAKDTEAPAANNVACTNANLLGNGCEFALKAVAKGNGKLIFAADAGAANLNGAKETIAIEVTAKQ